MWRDGDINTTATWEEMAEHSVRGRDKRMGITENVGMEGHICMEWGTIKSVQSTETVLVSGKIQILEIQDQSLPP